MVIYVFLLSWLFTLIVLGAYERYNPQNDTWNTQISFFWLHLELTHVDLFVLCISIWGDKSSLKNQEIWRLFHVTLGSLRLHSNTDNENEYEDKWDYGQEDEHEHERELRMRTEGAV